MNIIRENDIFYIKGENGKDAYISFVINDGVLTIEHTVVSDKLKGQGIGKLLVKEVVDYVRANKWKINSTCWFAEGLLKKTDEWQDLLA